MIVDVSNPSPVANVCVSPSVLQAGEQPKPPSEIKQTIILIANTSDRTQTITGSADRSES